MERKSRLREMREEAGLTQEELSKKLGIPRSSLCNWEIDVSTISIAIASKLADFFGVTIDYLVGRVDEDPTRLMVKKAIKKIDLDALAEFISKQKF